MDSRPTWGESMRISSRTVVLCLARAVILTAPIIGPARAGTMQTFIVLYSAQAVPADAARTITNAGGVFVYAYNAIGVVIARSDSPLFRDTLLADSRIENVSSTAGFATNLRDVETAGTSGPPSGGPVNITVADSDSLSPLQWDMIQIHTPEAHAITGGSPSVLVGDIDTGLDYNHPDLAANVDSANSANCVSGAPVPGAVAANDDNGHGTHTAGTIAAAANGIGIVGVAPNVHIAGIKAGNGGGFLKSYYSSYGSGVAQVVAPGGDSRFGVTAAAPNGRALSTYPASLMNTCVRKVFDPSSPLATYCYLQGTSMASPHVAGVAA